MTWQVLYRSNLPRSLFDLTFGLDPVTAIVSAQRLSKVNFDKLLMAHQDSPLLEGARGAVETLVAESIQKLKR